MRNVAIAVALSAALLGSCKSSKADDGPREPEAAPKTSMSMDADAEAAEPMQESGPAWEDMSLAERKKAFLVSQHIENAKSLRSDLRLEEAERELMEALRIAPENVEALGLLAEITTVLGREGDDVAATMSQAREFRKERLVEEANDGLRKAKVLLARGDYDGAVTELSLAKDVIRYAPSGIDWGATEAEVSELLASTISQRDAAQAAEAEAAQRQTLDELQREEVADRERRQRMVENLVDQAIDAFDAQRYEEAIVKADEALRLEPRHEKALDIRDTAFRASRERVRADYLEDKREQYLRWQESIDELRVPYNEILTLPDEEFWRDITKKRSQRRGIDLTQNASAAELELRKSLRTQTIPGLSIEDEESLIVVIDALRAITGLPLIVDPAADQAALDEGIVYTIDLTNPITVDKALNLITGMSGEEVTWTVRHDTVLVTTREKARGALIIYNHDVQDLIFGLTDFLGPRIDRLRLVDELEDDDGGGPFGGLGERPTINEPDDLETLVRENVAVDTWDENGTSIAIENGNMLVVHTPEVQMQVRRFLEDLRRFSASSVTIESKFMTIGDNFIQEIGVEFRGLDNPGAPFTDLDGLNLDDMPTLGLDNSGNPLTPTAPSAGAFYDDDRGEYKGRTEHIFDNPLGEALTVFGGLSAQYTFLDDLQASVILRMVEKSQQVELLNEQVLSVYNTQRAFVTVINQQAYVQDFDVEVAQFQAIADPVINVLSEGIVLDVRPTIHQNRRQLSLEIQPTVARIVSLTPFSTSLSGATQAVTFQLPELEVQSVFTTAVVPDGGTILIGGLSRVRNVERRAEVPWIANIPIVGFFFKEEGYNDEKQSLMIMLRAWISDMKAELARFETE